jgi:hypothetical protein
MHAPQYRTENSGALMSDWPRIPLPATADLLTRSAALGGRLAELLDPESYIRLTADWSFLAALKLPKSSDLENALMITAGWGHRGQGSTVMPGQGLFTERPWTAAEREKIAALAPAQSTTLEDALALLEQTCAEVHLNGESFWSAVPIKVWSYTLGGYPVLKKWLSYREVPLLGRPLHSEEAAYFAQVVRRICAIILPAPPSTPVTKPSFPPPPACPPVDWTGRRVVAIGILHSRRICGKKRELTVYFRSQTSGMVWPAPYASTVKIREHFPP